MDWEALFRASSIKLTDELAECRAALEHRGLKGTANETALTEVLRGYLYGRIPEAHSALRLMVAALLNAGGDQ
jgi:hypothetical protein